MDWESRIQVNTGDTLLCSCDDGCVCECVLVINASRVERVSGFVLPRKKSPQHFPWDLSLIGHSPFECVSVYCLCTCDGERSREGGVCKGVCLCHCYIT